MVCGNTFLAEKHTSGAVQAQIGHAPARRRENTKGYNMALFGNKETAAENGEHYDGDLVNGVRHGRGTMRYANGNVYSGQWKNGLKCGMGQFYFASTGDVYIGEFSNDRLNGYGHMKYHTGQVFEGYYSNGVRDGSGTLLCPDGKRFEGTWVGDKLNGMAIVWYADGSFYRAMYANGKGIDGFITERDSDGFWRKKRLASPELENLGGYSVTLLSFPENRKIEVIKEVREITGYGLAVAKELTENAPQWLVKGLPQADAEAAKSRLEAVGARAEAVKSL